MHLVYYSSQVLRIPKVAADSIVQSKTVGGEILSVFSDSLLLLPHGIKVIALSPPLHLCSQQKEGGKSRSNRLYL